MKNILFIAPPAGGKGTIGEQLEDEFGYEHVSTGDLIREIDEESEIGKQVQKCMKVGKFVDDRIVLSLLKKKLLEMDNKPFILDGFPRSITQAKELDELFEKINKKIDLVIFIDIDYDTCLKRAIGRVSCPNCHETYNIFFRKPKIENVCDECGTELVKRIDDNEESFEKRFKTYEKNTLPLVDFYKEKGILVTVDKNNTYEKVRNEIKK